MSGRDASRGFWYQAIASVLEALTNDNWNELCIEPASSNTTPNGDEKIDIILKSSDNTVRCIQVKSTNGSFTSKKIDEWIDDLTSSNASGYQLTLIGQCSNRTMTHIRKRNENAAKKIHISVLPFGSENLEALLIASLHRYLCTYNHILPHEQLKFIASKLRDRHMEFSTQGNYISKEEFNNAIKETISQLTQDYSNDRIPIIIKSYSSNKTDCFLNLSDKFHGRKLQASYNWQDDIYTPLKDKLESLQPGPRYMLSTEAMHTSIAFACGRLLNPKRTNINIYPTQCLDISKEIVIWDSKSCGDVSYPDWNILFEKLSENTDCALVLNITHSAMSKVKQYIETENLKIGTLINCSLYDENTSEILSGPSVIKDGLHVYKLTSSLYDRFDFKLAFEQKQHFHIFASAPNAFMFFLGEHLSCIPKCTVYEFDYTNESTGSYSPSITC